MSPTRCSGLGEAAAKAPGEVRGVSAKRGSDDSGSVVRSGNRRLRRESSWCCTALHAVPSLSFFFFSPHKINAQLLLLPPRELLTLRSQHLCTCQPLRSHSQSGLRSLLLGTDLAFGWRGEEMSFPATKTRARGKEKRQPSRSLSLWATDAASVVNTPCKLLCGSVCGSFFLCKALNTKVPSEQQQRALIRLHYACMEKQTNKKN